MSVHTVSPRTCNIYPRTADVLEVKGVTKKFDGVTALKDVRCAFMDGKITGLIGPNGAGKTTLFNVINGFMDEDDGQVFLDDQDLTDQPAWHIARMGIGRLFQDVRVFEKMTSFENVVTAAKRQPGENPINALFRPGIVGEREKGFKEEAEQWLEFVELSDLRDAPAEDLSFGQQKLLAIARLLAGNSDVLLLDEPAAGINPEILETILSVIQKLVDQGKTVVVIEHDMHVIEKISDLVYFLEGGEVVTFGRPTEILEDEEIQKAYIGV